MINIAEARMIAKELHRLVKKDIERVLKESMVEVHNNVSMNAAEAAKYLGWKIQTLYNNKSHIPHFKVGSKLRFHRSDLDAFINEGKFNNVS